MLKKILWAIVIIIIIGGAYATYLWFKPHRDIIGESAEYELESTQLMEQYRTNEQGADEKYLDKVILVSGDVLEAEKAYIKLSQGVYCTGDFSSDVINIGEKITIKGRIVGYDELFEEVRMDNCTVEKL